MADFDDLQDACSVWQDNRDGGSTPIRAAARRISQVPHYFEADWLRKIEDAAEADERTMRRAEVLMKAVAANDPLDALGWCTSAGLATAFAGRGLKRKPEDPQILESLRSGVLFMPLWGVSLVEDVAREYGEQWVFELDGPFHGIPAWQQSGVKTHEFEVIAGGVYQVLSEVGDPPTTVRIREVSSPWPPPKVPPHMWSIEQPMDFGDWMNRPAPRYEDDPE